MSAVVQVDVSAIPFPERVEMVSEAAEALLGGNFLIVGFLAKDAVLTTVFEHGSHMNGARAEAAVHDIMTAILENQDPCSNCPTCRSRTDRVRAALAALGNTSFISKAAPDGSMAQ